MRKSIPGNQGFADAVIVGDYVFTCGVEGPDPTTKKLVQGRIEQTRAAVNHLKSILEKSGSSLTDVVKLNVYVVGTTRQDMLDCYDVLDTMIPDMPGKAVNDLLVDGIPSGALIKLEAVATVKNRT